jgi:hypothetical protein
MLKDCKNLIQNNTTNPTTTPNSTIDNSTDGLFLTPTSRFPFQSFEEVSCAKKETCSSKI